MLTGNEMTDQHKTAVQWCDDIMECYERERTDYDGEDLIHEAMCCIRLARAQLAATSSSQDERIKIGEKNE
jgi:hypothetical protein